MVVASSSPSVDKIFFGEQMKASSARTTLILLLLLVVSSSLAAKRKTVRTTKDSFDRRTYGGDLYAEGRSTITTKQSFRRQVASTRDCTGKWCHHGNWGCQRGDSSDCYNVEHIIDRNGPEFASHPECKDVPGNMIMAHGRWNQALGSRAASSYTLSTAEKTSAYGQDIMDRARSSIRSCIEKRYGKRAVEEDIYINVTKEALFEEEDGILAVPAGSNVTCVECDLEAAEPYCEECYCDRCVFFEYVDEEKDPMLEAGAILFTIGILSLVVLAVSLGVVYLHKSGSLNFFRRLGSGGGGGRDGRGEEEDGEGKMTTATTATAK